MAQSKKDSFLEQTFNISIGFVLSMAVWEWIVAPLIFAGYLTVESTFAITLIFTIVSFVRGYILRRYFNGKVVFSSSERAQ